MRFVRKFYKRFMAGRILNHFYFPQFAAQDLSNGSLRERRYESNLFGNFIGRQVLPAMGDDFVVGEGGVTLHYEYLYRFAALRIGHANDAHFQNFGM